MNTLPVSRRPVVAKGYNHLLYKVEISSRNLKYLIVHVRMINFRRVRYDDDDVDNNGSNCYIL